MSSTAGGRGRDHRAVTIYDVAAVAGVSHQTVANVLNAPERVAAATRERVERHIDELGFRPNRVARNLSKRRSRLIGFCVRRRSLLSTGGILDAFLHALADAAEEIDHHVVLFSSDPGAAEAAKALELYRANVADAFVVAETEPGDERIPALVEAELQFVSFGRTDGTVPHHWVDTDNFGGSRLAAAHLADRGHTDIAFAGWPGESWVGDDRRNGWRAELEARGLPRGDDRATESINDRAAAAAACARMLNAQPDVTAVVAASDELALGVQFAAQRLDREVAVVGYDDSPLATLGQGLTSVRQPIPEIARRIVRITAALIAGEADDPVHDRVMPELIVRGSSPPPRWARAGSSEPRTQHQRSNT